jgi:hypothetical protein
LKLHFLGKLKYFLEGQTAPYTASGTQSKLTVMVGFRFWDKTAHFKQGRVYMQNGTMVQGEDQGEDEN